jgi:hypothetical protein
VTSNVAKTRQSGVIDRRVFLLSYPAHVHDTDVDVSVSSTDSITRRKTASVNCD